MKYDERFWDCRDYGHAWKFIGITVTRSVPVEYVRVLECMRGCDTTRTEGLSQGRTTRRYYGYDHEYKIPEKLRGDKSLRQAHQEIRQKNLRRQMKKMK